MQGPIAQIIAITTHGSAFLASAPRFDATNFYPANTTFAFCEYVKFVDLERTEAGWQEIEFASDPLAWFARLQEEDVHALRLSHIQGRQKIGDAEVSDRMLVGLVGGGGRWLMEASKPDGSDHWEGRWEIGDRNRADRKIWRVSYGRVAGNQPSSSYKTTDLEKLKAKLGHKLAEIAEFARGHDLGEFASAFESGRSLLTSQEPTKGVYHTDIAPHQFLSRSALQLLGAAQAAWVFGGMGSWNDLGFDGKDRSRYEQVSEDLYQLLNEAMVAAANSCAQATPPRRKI
jgi:hypothetical protein